MSQVYLGTSGWAYSSWKPTFYPKKLVAKKFLDHYATQLNAVEINYTFRAYPRATTLAGWIASTPEDFRFAAKAHQRITHIKRLNVTLEDLRWTFESLRPLAEAQRLGPILFQLPPNLKADRDRLATFLVLLPKGQRYAFEFRHQSWFDEKIFAVLREHNVALCIAESDDLVTKEVHTADFAYYRLRRSDYTEKELAKIQGRIQNALQRGEVFAFFKHEETPEGALNAVKLRHRLNAARHAAEMFS
jgi:uncharacterized protein YecE (DUF72 family)